MRMAAGRWELDIRPERGGRIVSIRLDGEELLDQGIGVDQPTAKGFVEGGAFGWDEMVPTVDATDHLPDHGEAWRLPWQTLRKADVEVSMRCRGRVVPWELTRSVYLRPEDSLIAVYTYRNVGKTPHLAYWCAHPLFRYEPDMEVSPDIPRPADGESAKVFLPPGTLDRAHLRWRSGKAIEIGWDPKLTPYVGVWVCNGALGGYRQIAIEPATGGGDRPDHSQPPPLLEPGKELRWVFAIAPLD